MCYILCNNPSTSSPYSYDHFLTFIIMSLDSISEHLFFRGPSISMLHKLIVLCIITHTITHYTKGPILTMCFRPSNCLWSSVHTKGGSYLLGSIFLTPHLPYALLPGGSYHFAPSLASIQLSKNVWPNLIWLYRCLIWLENVWWLAIVISPACISFFIGFLSLLSTSHSSSSFFKFLFSCFFSLHRFRNRREHKKNLWRL